MLKITTTPALIGINTINAKLDISQPKADLNMHTEHAKVEINSENPKVIIDQYQCFAEAGLKNILDLTRETAQISKQAALKGIERRVSQGNQMADIHKDYNPIAEMADYNAFELFNREFNFGLIPKSRPKIDIIEGNVDIKVHEGKANMDVKINRPQVDYTRGKVEIYLRQKNSIDIQYIGENVDRKI
ncbi:DUF6470 family protein [Maledivibacter halophilus]|uniref:YviE n=1 Tax=Maledivibacter halophilus TaxID=36842 RepID=A0A1T5JXC3_9FIRM|nr:DUF6470 family protein [Maledivibacter halophilus]SKC55899.1 hypothetical protein SAMN02194393_01413 [Maledivibacter halophilus]